MVYHIRANGRISQKLRCLGERACSVNISIHQTQCHKALFHYNIPMWVGVTFWEWRRRTDKISIFRACQEKGSQDNTSFGNLAGPEISFVCPLMTNTTTKLTGHNALTHRPEYQCVHLSRSVHNYGAQGLAR